MKVILVAEAVFTAGEPPAKPDQIFGAFFLVSNQDDLSPVLTFLCEKACFLREVKLMVPGGPTIVRNINKSVAKGETINVEI